MDAPSPPLPALQPPLRGSSQDPPRPRVSAALAAATLASESGEDANSAREADPCPRGGHPPRGPPHLLRCRCAGAGVLLAVVGCWSTIAAIAAIPSAAAVGAHDARTTSTRAIVPWMDPNNTALSNHHTQTPSALHQHAHLHRHSQSQHPFQPRWRMNDDAPASLLLLRQRRHHQPSWASLRGGARAAAAQAVRPISTLPPKTPPRDNAASTEKNATNKASSSSSSSDTATLFMTFNLVKGILGSGILALPAGMATIVSTNHVSAILPATLLLALTGMVAAYGFALLGILCDATGATTYREVWIATVGRGRTVVTTTGKDAATKKGGSSCQTAWIPAAACLAVTFCTTLTYLMVLADTVPQLLRPILGGIQLSRATTLIALGAILAPLCLLRDLKKLAPISIVGLVGTLYTALAMAFRWYQHVVASSSTSSSSLSLTVPYVSHLLDVTQYWKHLKSPALFLSMLSTSFMAHYNAPRVYWELRSGTPGGRSASTSSVLPTYLTVVQWGFGAATAVMALIAASGFAVFGQNSAPNILASYPSTDSALAVGRAAIALSLVCTFPLAFVGIRNQLLELIVLPNHHQGGTPTSVTATTTTTTTTTVAATFGLLVVLVAAAHRIRDLRLVLAVGGSTWGNAVIYVLPSLMALHAAPHYPALRLHVRRATASLLWGLVLAYLGVGRIASVLRQVVSSSAAKQ